MKYPTNIILQMNQRKLAIPGKLYEDDRGVIYKGTKEFGVEVIRATDTELATLIRALLVDPTGSSTDTLEDVRSRDNVVNGPIDMGGFGIINGADPVNPQDFVTLSFAQSLITGSGNHQSFVCGGSISSGNVVSLISNQIFRYNPGVSSNYLKLIGIATQAGVIGDTIDIQLAGLYIQTGYGLTPNTVYYAGAAGTITNIAPTSGISQPVGISGDSDSIVINIARPTLKS